MSYRERDLLEKVTQAEPGKQPPKRPRLLHALKEAAREAILRRVSTKR